MKNEKSRVAVGIHLKKKTPLPTRIGGPGAFNAEQEKQKEEQKKEEAPPPKAPAHPLLVDAYNFLDGCLARVAAGGPEFFDVHGHRLMEDFDFIYNQVMDLVEKNLIMRLQGYAEKLCTTFTEVVKLIFINCLPLRMKENREFSDHMMKQLVEVSKAKKRSEGYFTNFDSPSRAYQPSWYQAFSEEKISNILTMFIACLNNSVKYYYGFEDFDMAIKYLSCAISTRQILITNQDQLTQLLILYFNLAACYFQLKLPHCAISLVGDCIKIIDQIIDSQMKEPLFRPYPLKHCLYFPGRTLTLLTVFPQRSQPQSCNIKGEILIMLDQILKKSKCALDPEFNEQIAIRADYYCVADQDYYYKDGKITATLKEFMKNNENKAEEPGEKTGPPDISKRDFKFGTMSPKNNSSSSKYFNQPKGINSMKSIGKPASENNMNPQAGAFSLRVHSVEKLPPLKAFNDKKDSIAPPSNTELIDIENAREDTLDPGLKKVSLAENEYSVGVVGGTSVRDIAGVPSVAHPQPHQHSPKPADPQPSKNANLLLEST